MSTRKEGTSEEKSLLGKLEIQDLPRDARAQILLAAYLAYGPETSHPARLRDLSLRTGMGYNALSQVSARRRWKEALQATQEAPATTETGGVSVKAVESVHKAFSALQMAAGIRAYASICNDVCLSFSRSTQKLVALLTARLDKKFVEYGEDLSYVEAVDLVLEWKAISEIMEASSKYLSPAVQAQLLSSVGFTASLPQDLPEDLDREAFTLTGLQKNLEKLGLRSIVGDTQAATDAFAQYEDIMPQITGTR